MPPSIATPFHWAVFLGVFLGVLLIDLAIFGRGTSSVSLRKSALWTLFCVSLALGFGAWLFVDFGARPGLEFITGYLVEYALSVDNLFVFLVIFTYFAVPLQSRHRVLFWGVLGALVFRALFLVGGVA